MELPAVQPLPEDMDGWYISLALRYSMHFYYLRKLDSGWRLFSASTAGESYPSILSLKIERCDEETLLAILEGRKKINSWIFGSGSGFHSR